MDRAKEIEMYKEYMTKCIALAESVKLRSTSIRPYLGAPYVAAMVLDSSGKPLSEGYRSFLEGTSLLLHAERVAIDSANIRGRPHTIITTLQPCVRYSPRQLFDSCSELIVKSGIKRVVLGSRDDNLPSGAEQGIGYLRNRNIEVIELKGFGERIRTTLLANNRQARRDNFVSRETWRL